MLNQTKPGTSRILGEFKETYLFIMTLDNIISTDYLSAKKEITKSGNTLLFNGSLI